MTCARPPPVCAAMSSTECNVGPTATAPMRQRRIGTVDLSSSATFLKAAPAAVRSQKSVCAKGVCTRIAARPTIIWTIFTKPVQVCSHSYWHMPISITPFNEVSPETSIGPILPGVNVYCWTPPTFIMSLKTEIEATVEQSGNKVSSCRPSPPQGSSLTSRKPPEAPSRRMDGIKVLKGGNAYSNRLSRQTAARLVAVGASRLRSK
ncbi:hypothetical protein C8R44DRAFT_752640 [Mycena epipterygia]|nr:hypothetical protein C8R44DRAFT_752640 [Mycena epipterygia]